MQFTTSSTSLLISGPAGALETVVEKPSIDPLPIVTIICHPHPLQGGSMTNKVVTTVSRAVLRLGIWAVRFNFRGVGKSAGQYDHGIGEVDDLMAVIKEISQYFPHHALWLAGFSFGSFVVAKMATKIPVSKLILIAPPVHHFNYAVLPEFSGHWILVQGESDEVVPPDQVFNWAQNRINPPEIIRLPHVGHFFHGELITLRELLIEALKKNI